MNDSKSSLEIRNSKIQGKGIFAQKFFDRDNAVFLFSDRTAVITHKHGCHCEICCRCIQIGPTEWLFPHDRSLGWNLNHSCNPSCGIRENNIVALRKIIPGEEITIDYSTTNADNSWQMQCGCGTENCRNTIRSIQYLPEVVYQKLFPYTPSWVAAQRNLGI